ncbi:unnamed protein product [Notodromas monacha]|uniref:Negative elongation factor B n=1 Tax=Notodromas monacha TaxID=399045 RepID=A0A7R9GBG2_9CRUS|nr:unnamed protein product [Notodromas monacha]CAG0915038.1 unnamed protein product [Notodromas monacha]
MADPLEPPPDEPGFGLEEIGIPGRKYLAESLTNCSDPMKAIEEFQVRINSLPKNFRMGRSDSLENGILVPSLRPMLPLLDLHGVKRLEFHVSVMEALREKLVERLNSLGQLEGPDRDAKIMDLMKKSFPVVKIKQLRPVVMAILKYVPNIDPFYLNVLVSDKELYRDCEIEVKRQMWERNQSLFGDEVSPLLSQYIREKENVLFDHENLSNLFFSPSPKMRRQGEVVQKLAKMLGRNVRLYDMVLQFLRTLFLRTKNPHYCTLRAELLMALHDLEVQEITSVDPCHKFTWCLDACIRERAVDSKRCRELQCFLDTLKQGQEEVLGDIAMVLCDPFSLHFLSIAALKILNHCMNQEGLPRENAILVLLLRMMSVGMRAWDMIESQMFKEPKLSVGIVTRFLPALVSLLVDDQVRAVNAKLPPDERETALAIIEHSGPPPDAYSQFVQDTSVAALLAMYYTLSVARTKDRTALIRTMGVVASAHNSRAFDDTFLHSFVALLVPMVSDFAHEDFCTAVFDEFFFTNIGRENVCRHVLKLVWYVFPKLPDTRRLAILKALQQGTMKIVKNHIQSTNQLLQTGDSLQTMGGRTLV